MGCAQSNNKDAEIQAKIKEQTLKIEKLKRENEEMKRMMNGLTSAQETMRTQSPADIEDQVLRLESKLIELGERIAVKHSSDTLVRNEDVPNSPMLTPQQKDEKSVNEVRESVWDDPKIKEMLEKHKRKFVQKAPVTNEASAVQTHSNS